MQTLCAGAGRNPGADMDIFLHIGAHRAASTSFQHYMRANKVELRARGVAFWGPVRLRNGLLHGVMPVPSRRSMAQQMARAQGRIALKLAKLEDRGFDRLVISDENMMGSMRHNMRDGCLYSAVGERMARYHAAFGTRVRRVTISLRAPQEYWESAFAYCLMRAGQVPDAGRVARIAAMRRTWRDVITDIACAMPGIEIVALAHESSGGHAGTRLAALLGDGEVPIHHAHMVRNARPGMSELRSQMDACGALRNARGRGCDALDFLSDETRAAMAEGYQDDLLWLRAGADGLARFCEETVPEKAGINPVHGATERGQVHGTQRRHMA